LNKKRERLSLRENYTQGYRKKKKKSFQIELLLFYIKVISKLSKISAIIFFSKEVPERYSFSAPKGNESTTKKRGFIAQPGNGPGMELKKASL
jgi:hypothetical protein